MRRRSAAMHQERSAEMSDECSAANGHACWRHRRHEGSRLHDRDDRRRRAACDLPHALGEPVPYLLRARISWLPLKRTNHRALGSTVHSEDHGATCCSRQLVGPHKRPARQQVRCVLSILTLSFRQRLLNSSAHLSASAYARFWVRPMQGYPHRSGRGEGTGEGLVSRGAPDRKRPPCRSFSSGGGISDAPSGHHPTPGGGAMAVGSARRPKGSLRRTQGLGYSAGPSVGPRANPSHPCTRPVSCAKTTSCSCASVP
jgi:hypothetical protein